MKKRHLSLTMTMVAVIIGSVGINMGTSGNAYAHKKLECVERSINTRPAGGFWRPAPCDRYDYVMHIHRYCSYTDRNGTVITGQGCFNVQHD